MIKNNPQIVFGITLALLISIPVCVTGQPFPKEPKTAFSFGPEYDWKNFTWSIAGSSNGNYVNVLSELIFKPVNSAGLFVEGIHMINRRFSLQASYHRQSAFSGAVSDKDYAGQNRTEPVVELYLQSSKGNSNHASGNLNYAFVDKTKFIALGGAGYHYSRELFYLTDKLNSNLRSTYAAYWHGPFVSVKGTAHLNERIYTDGGILFHYLFYHSKANWNLLEVVKHPVSFAQHANGSGFDFQLGGGYRLKKNFVLGLRGSYENWRTAAGKDELYLNTGETLTTTMNGAFRKSFHAGVYGTVLF